MEHRKLVLPEYLNDQGNLFGGYLLKWLDEFAYITASLEFPGNRFVTVALDDLEFKRAIQCGDILCFDVTMTRRGTTSVTYDVRVRNAVDGDSSELFETNITFVNVDENGEKRPIG